MADKRGRPGVSWISRKLRTGRIKNSWKILLIKCGISLFFSLFVCMCVISFCITENTGEEIKIYWFLSCMHNISGQDSKSTTHWLSYRAGGYKGQRHGQVLSITVFFSTAMSRIFIKTIPWEWCRRKLLGNICRNILKSPRDSMLMCFPKIQTKKVLLQMQDLWRKEKEKVKQ